jgi:SAM-dependent methyltransferase
VCSSDLTDDARAEKIARATSTANRTRTSNLRFRVGDVAALPFADNSVDLVVSTLSLHHWDDPAAGLNEIVRVLGPGGQAWIYDFRTALTATQPITSGLDADVALESPLIGTTRLNPIARRLGTQQRHGAVDVLNVGGMDLHGKQQAQRVGDDVALATLHLLGHIKPAWAATFRGLHTLAVDHAGRRHSLAPVRLARALHQHEIDPTPNARIAPTIEIVLNRRTRRKILGQHPPLAPTPKNVQDRTHHDPQINLARSSNLAGRRQQWSKKIPFPVPQVACIAKVIASILFAGDFSPNHVVPPRSFATTRESQLAEITQLYFSAKLSG